MIFPLCLMLLSVMSYWGFVTSDITCYHCTNTSIQHCHNTTITCRSPADSCYVILSQDRQTIRKSCVWKGHCAPQLLCNAMTSCHLQCCSDADCCNVNSDHEDWVTDTNADPVNWCYVVILYMILPSFVTIGYIAFPPLSPPPT